MTFCFKCDAKAVIACIALDAPKAASIDERTMHLCYEHFWDWNAHSLERRHLHDTAQRIREHIALGQLSTEPAGRFPRHPQPIIHTHDDNPELDPDRLRADMDEVGGL